MTYSKTSPCYFILSRSCYLVNRLYKRLLNLYLQLHNFPYVRNLSQTLLDCFTKNAINHAIRFQIFPITPHHAMMGRHELSVVDFSVKAQWAKSPKKQSVGVSFWQHGTVFWVPNWLSTLLKNHAITPQICYILQLYQTFKITPLGPKLILSFPETRWAGLKMYQF